MSEEINLRRMWCLKQGGHIMGMNDVRCFRCGLALSESLNADVWRYASLGEIPLNIKNE